MDRFEVTRALRELEDEKGRTPSVQEVADHLKVSSATAWIYLKEAAYKGLIVQRDGKFMSLEIARAYKVKE